MNKKMLIAFFLLCIALQAGNVFAQPGSDRAEQDYIFQRIDKSAIPTGYLEEYSAELAPLIAFNGVLSDSNRSDAYSWHAVYATWYSAKIYGPDTIPGFDSVYKALYHQLLSMSDTNAMLLLYGNYDRIREDALSANLLGVENEQFYDIEGRQEIPYETMDLYAAAPLRSTSDNGTFSLVFKEELFFTNSTKSIKELEVDFGNGLGFTGAVWDEVLTGIYETPGKYTLTIRAHFTDKSVYDTYSDIWIRHSEPIVFSIGERIDVPAFPPNASHSGGTVSVIPGKGNNTGYLRKPLIVAEGYDASYIVPSISKNYSINAFISDIDIYSDNEGFSFFNHLTQNNTIEDYDIVFLDYKNGTDHIARNAALLEEVITWVNSNKALGGSKEENVVMGISMGGLVSRYCLAKMVKNGNDPDTRLLITHDSPHQGANVPLGIQHLAKDAAAFQFSGLKAADIFPQLREAMLLAEQPATKQLLILRAVNLTDSVDTNSFLKTEYRNMITFAGDTQPYEFIATSQGSQCGKPLFNPYSTLVTTSGEINFHFFLGFILSTKYKINVDVHALPVYTKQEDILKIKLKRRISIYFIPVKTKTIYESQRQSPANTIPWDGIPGGTFNASSELSHATEPGSYTAINPFLIPFLFTAEFNGVQGEMGFTFVPEASALDVQTINASSISQPYMSYDFDPAEIGAKRFISQNKYVVNGSDRFNQSHVIFSARFARWIYNEMEALPNGEICEGASECGNNFSFLDNIRSSIPNAGIPICVGTRQYLSAPVNNGFPDISWSVGSNLQIISVSDDTVLVEAIAAGNGTVTATGVKSCGTQVLNRSVKIVAPGLNNGQVLDADYSITRNIRLMPNLNTVQGSQARVSFDVLNASSVTYTLLSGTPSSWNVSADGLHKLSVAAPTPQVIRAEVSITNSCGTFTGEFELDFKCIPNPGLRTSVYPNPGKDELIIDYTNLLKNELSTNPETTLTLFDIYGKKLLTERSTSPDLVERLKIAGISQGIYLLKIEYGNQTEIHKIHISE
jgi:hypothetical protein